MPAPYGEAPTIRRAHGVLVMTAIDPASDQPVTSGPQAGWYHDPAVQDGTRLRWWDGASWSEHIRPVAAPPAFPAPSAQVPVAAATAAYATAPAPPRAFLAPSAQVPVAPATAAYATAPAPQVAAAIAPRRALHNGTAWWSF